MNITTTSRTTIRRARIALAGIAAVASMAGSGAASATQTVPDQGTASITQGSPEWDADQNMAARHAHESVIWWSKFA